MKIKNIRQYRTFYKDNVRDLPNRNEHHLGTFRLNDSGKREFGWFEIYHGDKEGYGKAEQGIGNFLQSFLDMAKDGQAVYEFLQNAVDAGASHFTMAWGKDEVDGNHYVLIANNGKMFDFNSIRSILNVGSSTKTSDSQSIGKFGIGFKLAHRLVGKENGLDELLGSEPSGPILFSWKDAEISILSQEGVNPQPVDIEFESSEDIFKIKDSNPWLFKILITCFPALPENDEVQENVILANGAEASSPVFSKQEFNALQRWVSEYRDILTDEVYKEGSLFFIKLGTGKENDLADKNLGEGVRFSLAILQETAEADKKENQLLSTVQLNKGEPIHKPDLHYHYFKITKQSDTSDYLFVRFGVRSLNELNIDQKSKYEKEDDIEVLFGFRGYDEIGDYFKGAPNFYLYFPLSEEVHNFNFVLHSNAFYKASSRTFLHKGTQGEDGINERLLRVIAGRLERELLNLFEIRNHKKFLDFYAALLTSSESNVYERQWVKEPFIDEITKVLKKLVPVRKSLGDEMFSLTSLQPSIKKTNVEVPPAAFGVASFNWFYWGPNSPDIIRDKAFDKLKPLPFDIFTLLQKQNIHSYVNNWIEEDRSRIELIFKELNYFNKDKAQSDYFKNNLKALKLFEFSDGELLSDNEVASRQDEGYLILHNKLQSIRETLELIGIKTSRLNLDDYDFFRNYNPYLNPTGQLRSQAKIIEIISNGQVEGLGVPDKVSVFVTLRDMIDDKKIERLSELRLFKNSRGECLKLKHLLKSTDKDWLKPFVIDSTERNRDLEVYLLSEENKVYESVIKPFWEAIAKGLINQSLTVRVETVRDLENYYRIGNDDKTKNISNETQTLFFQGGIKVVDFPFYHSNLVKFQDEDYEQIQILLDEKFGIQIPDRQFLFSYQYDFLKIEEPKEIFTADAYELNFEEIKKFLQFVATVKISLFSEYCITENEDSFHISKGEEKNYFAGGDLFVDAYIKKNPHFLLVKFPEKLSEYGNLVSIKFEALYNELVDKSNEDNIDELFEIIGASSFNVKAKFFDKLNKIQLNFHGEDITSNKSKLIFINELIGEDGFELKQVQDKIIISTEESNIALNEVDVANDQILIEHGGTTIQLSRSKLLNLQDERAIPTILSFAEKTIEQSLLTERQARKIFKVSRESINQELFSLVQSVISEQDNQLINTDQLILFLISVTEDEINTSNLLVETISNEWVRLEGNFLLLDDESNRKWYNDSNVLSVRYSDFFNRINFKKGELFDYSTSPGESEAVTLKNVIYHEFLFQNSISPDVLNTQEDKTNFLEFLFNQWKKTPVPSRIKLLDYEWNRLLDFNPSEKVIGTEVLESEILEEYVINWINENTTEKERFLACLGVHTSESKIVRFRKWILNAIDGTPLPVSLDEIPLHLISNTLVGLADGFANSSKQFSYGIHSNKFQILLQLISKLLNCNENYELRVPVWVDETNVELGDEKGQWPYYLDDEDLQLLKKPENINVFLKLIQSEKIIYSLEIFKDFSESTYPKLEKSIVFSQPISPSEHIEPFYNDWSKENGISLFRCDKLLYDFVIQRNSGEVNIGSLETKNVEVLKDENENIIIYYQRNLSLESLSEELSNLGYNDESSEIDNLVAERDRILSAFYHTLTSSGKGSFDAEDSKRILEVLNERSLEEKRNEIVEEIKNSQKYSYNWFKNFIQYLLTFEESSDTISQKSISFQKIERFYADGIPSQKYFTLKGASSLIPLNIEAFENFSVSITFSNRQKENLVVEGVSKKGQDLLVYVPKGIDESLISRFERVIHVTINFIPVLDLLERLRREFENESVIAPWENINESLPPLHFIYGPPGTGKTTKLVDSLTDRYLENYNFKSLVIVPTNKAGDVLAKRLIERNEEISVIRLGGPTDPELENLNENVYQISLDEGIFESTNVIITTVHRLPYYQISVAHGAGFKLFDRERAFWDLVIFDEASMISLPYFAFSLHALHSKNSFVVAGDPKQIPAVVDVPDNKLEEIEIADESIYKMLQIESFDSKEQILRSIDSIDNLITQYRSVKVVGELFSTISYNGLLKHGRDFVGKPVKTLPESFFNPLKSNISFIDLPLDTNNSILEPKKLLYSPYHVYAGILATELIVKLDKCLDGTTNFTVGVISPYKAQAMIMNKLITSSGLSKNVNVYCDTVHGFQGDECDIVIFVVNPNQMYFTNHPNSLLSKDYIYNVAISRSKDYLWVICPFKSIRNNHHVNKLLDVAGGHKTLVNSGDLEQYLFNEREFIVKNTYLTGHDNINVFGQVEMSYFIKAGSTAVDIQLRK